VPPKDAFSPGDVTASALAGGSTRLVFDNPINLDLATQLQYSIALVGSSALPISSDPIPFALSTAGTAPDTYQYFDLPSTLQSPGQYLIELRFLDGSGNLLGEKTVSYRKLT